MRTWLNQSHIKMAVTAVMVVTATITFIPTKADAAGLQSAMLRLDRMKTSTATGGLVCIKAASTATEGKIVITFPTTYTLNTTAANWTVATAANLYGTSTAWPSITTASAVDNTTKTVTFGSGDLTVGTLYCFTFSGTNTLTTATTAAASQQATIATQTSANAPIDLSYIALANIADDQIVVTAVVPPSFVFVLSGNTDAYQANLDPASIVSTNGRTVTVTTNAKGGWVAWAKDSQQGLFSTTANYTISNSSTLNGAGPLKRITAGTEGQVMDTDITTDASGGCTLAVDASFDGGISGTTGTGGALTAAFLPIASCGGTSPATANGDVITLTQRAAISGATPAASDYTDIVTVVGAGNF